MIESYIISVHNIYFANVKIYIRFYCSSYMLNDWLVLLNLKISISVSFITLF